MAVTRNYREKSTAFKCSPSILPAHQMFDRQLDGDALWGGPASQTGDAPSL